MTIISPSILGGDFLNIENEITQLNEAVNIWHHLDIMDGHFVPNLTFGHPIIKRLSSITKHKLDAHLMVTNPEFYVETFKDYGIHNITFHVEALKTEKELLRLIKKAKTLYQSVGISIKPKTPLSTVPNEILQEIDLFLMMSVEPGFGGQSFIENTYSKLDELTLRKSKSALSFQIQVDGGVSNLNCYKLISHGVDNLVAGSYIFKTSEKNYIEKIKSLKEVPNDN